ncbi:hypothetical protein BIV57_07955 [Mangrovactinospora gilvigrisea]|uniref:UDP-glucose 4-epimerase n=1 Tax=Mangrovactinospora gilvigrisea TaxID=1428644 RepID=A0A1J7C8Z5_9ACTN|nr:NAD-dependent epimerase/dehydratase family protein [Mangrovactinospora gilvigrisea]OIV38000.1 hypothetical protein BIV57_07955 [Mangrovactinospora gilvigrisea]
MRVLVTGGFGFSGTALVHRLTEAGHTVIVLTRRPRWDLVQERVVERALFGDVRDEKAVRTAMYGVDAVCHFAALTRVRDSFERPDEYRDVNVDGTRTVLAAAVAEGKRRGRPLVFLQASTAAVYGAPELQPIAETAPPAPSSPYGRTKLEADELVLQAATAGSVSGVVLRAFNVCGAVDGVGDSDLTRIIPKAIAVAAGEAPELGVNRDGTAIRDFVHVDDVARAYVLALDAAEPGRPQIYNVGATGASVADIIDAVQRLTGRNMTVIHNPPQPEPPTVLADSSLIRQRLGWSPERSSLDEIVRDAWAAAAASSGRRAAGSPRG